MTGFVMEPATGYRTGVVTRDEPGVPTSPTMRVAVIGGGPKAFHAVERLVHRWLTGSCPAQRLQIDVFEPDRFGAGAVWNARQPDELRVNYAATAVDAWVRGDSDERCAIVPDSDQRSLVDWLDATTGPDPFPSRRAVGDYLSAAAATFVDHLPESIAFTQHRTRVASVERAGGCWRVVTDEDGTFETEQVLLATGHASTWTGALTASGIADAIPAYPTDGWDAAVRSARPGSTVAVRGFGLTAIDVALRAEVIAPRVVIRPFARAGRPVLAKPVPDAAPLIGQDAAIRRGLEVLSCGSPDGPDGPAGLVVAAVLATVAAVDPESVDEARTYLTTGVGRHVVSPLEELRTSVRQAFGDEAPGAAAIVGDAWRRLYREIVPILAHRGPEGCWSASIDGLQRRMERLAFGPPPTTARRFVDMIDRGFVRLDALTGASLDARTRPIRLRTPDEVLAVDVLIDAVLPPPGVPDGVTGPVAGLLEAGRLRRVGGGRGIVVTADGCCVDASGRVDPTLSAIGRPTEDCIVGNDTLSRTLHDVADRWARHIARFEGILR